MKQIKLSDLEQIIKENNEKYKDVVDNYSRKLEERGYKMGRQRPRDPIEQKILDSFTKK